MLLLCDPTSKKLFVDRILDPELFMLSKAPLVSAVWADREKIVGAAKLVETPSVQLDHYYDYEHVYHVTREYGFNADYGEELRIQLKGLPEFRIEAYTYPYKISVRGEGRWLAGESNPAPPG